MSVGGDRLGTTAIRGGFAVVAGQLMLRAARSLTTLLLAGLLVPDDFGVVAIAVLAVQFTGVLANVGIGPSLQSLGNQPSTQRAALGMALIVGIPSMIAMLALAAPVASALGAAEATGPLRMLSVSLLLGRWTEVQAASLEADLKFGLTVRAQIGATVVASAVAIALAFSGAGPWSIVAQVVISDALTAIIMTLRRGLYQPMFDLAELRSLWAFGRHLLAGSMLVFLFTNIDDAAVARVLGTTALGYYVLAYRITNMPTYAITHSVTKVTLPIYIRVRDNQDRWRHSYLRVLHVISWMSGFVLVWLAVDGPSLLTLIYGERWVPMYPAFRVLCVYGLARSIGGTTGTLFLAAGRPDLQRRVTLWQTIAMILLLVGLIRPYEIFGASLAVTIPLLVGVAISLSWARRIVGADAGRVVAVTLTPLAVASTCSLAIAPARVLDGWLEIVTTLGAAILCAAGYAALRLRSELIDFRAAIRRKSARL